MFFAMRMLLFLVCLYIAVVVVGLLPVNNDFDPEAGEIQISLISNPVHADILVPIETDVVNWRDVFPTSCFREDTSHATHVAIGWGDRGFFLETPTWADLKLSTAAEALLWPSDSCMHVVMTHQNYGAADARQVRITTEQYQALAEFIQASFVNGQGEMVVQIPDAAYHTNDAFFEAHGSYNCLNTCNSWVGRGLRQCGVRTPVFSPLPKSVFLYLPSDSGRRLEH